MLRLISCGCCGMPRIWGRDCKYCVLFSNYRRLELVRDL